MLSKKARLAYEARCRRRRHQQQNGHDLPHAVGVSLSAGAIRVILQCRGNYGITLILSPYCAIILAALCNRAGHYIFARWFLLLSSFYLILLSFPRLISAVADWMPTILLHMV